MTLGRGVTAPTDAPILGPSRRPIAPSAERPTLPPRVLRKSPVDSRMPSAVGLTLVVRVDDDDELRAHGSRVPVPDEVLSAEVRTPDDVPDDVPSDVPDDLPVAVALGVDCAELRVRLQGDTWRAESRASDASERARELVDRSDEALRTPLELRV